MATRSLRVPTRPTRRHALSRSDNTQARHHAPPCIATRRAASSLVYASPCAATTRPPYASPCIPSSSITTRDTPPHTTSLSIPRTIERHYAFPRVVKHDHTRPMRRHSLPRAATRCQTRCHAQSHTTTYNHASHASPCLATPRHALAHHSSHARPFAAVLHHTSPQLVPRPATRQHAPRCTTTRHRTPPHTTTLDYESPCITACCAGVTTYSRWSQIAGGQVRGAPSTDGAPTRCSCALVVTQLPVVPRTCAWLHSLDLACY